jgi:hypothetical protein
MDVSYAPAHKGHVTVLSHTVLTFSGFPPQPKDFVMTCGEDGLIKFWQFQEGPSGQQVSQGQSPSGANFYPIGDMSLWAIGEPFPANMQGASPIGRFIHVV